MEQVKMNKGKVTLLAILAAILVIGVVFYQALFYTVDPGHEAYVFYTLGSGLDKDNVQGQGLHIKAPWDKVIDYDVRIQESMSEMEVLSKNGLTIKLELSYRYKPLPGKAGYIEEEIGSNYHDKVIAPEIKSVTREVIGTYLPEQLYSTARDSIEGQIYDMLKTPLEENYYLALDAVLIRDLTLPPTLQSAIENKLKEEQMQLEYEYKIGRAEAEKRRLIIEAEGRDSANLVLNRNLSEKVLRYKGIEATLKLAESSNSKVVVVGGGEDGLPLILNP